MENRSRCVTADMIDGLYYVRIAVRMFNPFLAITAQSPVRKQARRMVTEFFDYRAAQYSEALAPKGEEWTSRSDIQLEGDLRLLRPSPCDEMPDHIPVRARLSWWPAHVAFTWCNGNDVWQKLSARPPQGECEWSSTEYSDELFTDTDRAVYPEAFTVAPCPAKPDDEPKEKAPPADVAPVAASHDSHQVVTEEEKRHSPNHSPDVTDDHDWSNDWWSTRNGRRGANQWQDDSEDTVSRKSTPRPDASQSTPNTQPGVIEPPPPASPHWGDLSDTPRPSTDAIETALHSPGKHESALESAYVAEQVTVQTKTQSVEFKRELPDRGNVMLRPHKLALAGPPLSREDRLARQVLANGLSLSPQVYNLLVFGESEDTDTTDPIATCALPPPTTSQSP